MSAEIEVVLTPAARAIAERDWSVESLTAKVRAELHELLEGGLGELEDMMFHTVWQNSSRDENIYTVVPKGPATVTVYADSYVEAETELNAGPFKGMRVMVPSSVDDGEE